MTYRMFDRKLWCKRIVSTVAVATALLAPMVFLTGCNLVPAAAVVSPTGTALRGSVHGGQQPVTGAVLQLYAAGSTGYGSAAAPLIPSGSYYLGGVPGCVPSGTQTCYANVTTDSSGNFNITGDYSCSSSATPVYLVATGGSPSPGVTNPNIALMVAAGTCGQLQATAYIALNELTTVASVWSLSPFMAGITSLGTSSSNAQGLLNGFASVNKVVNTANGTLPGTALPSNATLPTAKLNTLADILASCINSGGGAAGDSSVCGTLFSAATVGTTAPTDTITAAMNLAQHPSLGTATLMPLATPTAPFQPILSPSSTPTDWTIAIHYTGGGLSTPKAIAVDKSGNVWLPNYGTSTVTELTSTGSPTSGSPYAVGSLSQPVALAVDVTGNAWVANSNNTVTKVAAGGASGTLYSGGSISTPTALAFDALGDLWIANFGNSSVTQINTSGVLTNYTGAGLASPVAITVSPK